MYSKTSWGGPVDPFILVKFLNTSNSDVKDPIASLVIFEWKDRNLVGIPDPNTPGNVSARDSLCMLRPLLTHDSDLASAVTISSSKVTVTRPILANSSCIPMLTRSLRAWSSQRLSTSTMRLQSTMLSRRPDTTAFLQMWSTQRSTT